MKKIVSIGLMLVLILGVFAGCGGASSSTEPSKADPASSDVTSTPDSKESVEETPATSTEEGTGSEISGKITFSSWDIALNDSYILDMVAKFEELNPSIEVEVIDIPGADYDQKLNVDLNGGAGADVFFVKKAAETVMLNNKGQLADLTPFIERDALDLAGFNGLDQNLNYNGAQAGLPFRTDYHLVFFNKDMFDAAGVEYPSNNMTWADYEEIAGKLTSGEGANKKYGSLFHTWASVVQNLAITSGEHTIMGPDYSFMKPAYDLALRLQESGNAQDFATLKTGNIHYSGAFQQGSVGMMPMGSWYMSTIINKIKEGETDVNWGIVTYPHFEGEPTNNAPGGITPMAINGASQNKEAAWELVKFMTSEEGADMMAKVGKFPGRLTDSMREDIAATEGMPEGAADALKVDQIVLDRPIAEMVSEVDAANEESHQLIMLGEMTVEEGLAEMELRSKEIQGIS